MWTVSDARGLNTPPRSSNRGHANLSATRRGPETGTCPNPRFFGLGKNFFPRYTPIHTSHLTKNSKEKLMTKNVLNKLGFLGAVFVAAVDFH